MTTEMYLDILVYKREVLAQLLTVASIFGGFAITGVVALRAEGRRDRLHGIAFLAFVVAATAFILTAALDAIWLPISNLHKIRSEESMRTVLWAGDIVIWAMLIGAASLMVAVGSFGFAHSRRMGIIVCAVTVAATSVFIFAVAKLASVT